MDSELRAGDFVILKDPRIDPITPYRIVYEVLKTSLSLIDLRDLRNPMHPEDVAHLLNGGTHDLYDKISPTKEMIKLARKNSTLLMENKEIDNLTYIEICARLREYELALAI
jgi:hypothetical protein